MSDHPWPIIIGGCYRSGTSLVRRILNTHSHIHCGPEVKFFRDFYGDYFEDSLKHLRFMTTARSLLPEVDLLEILGRAYIVLHERAAVQAGKRRWADKNPENVLYLEEWQHLLGDEWVFIHVGRNPLDNLASIKEMRFPLTIPPELEARIDLYRRYNQNGLSFGQAHPDRYYRVLYEQLVYSPRPTLEGLMKWLGEPFEIGQLAFNSIPQEIGLEDPKIAHTSEIHPESVRRWPNILTVEEARMTWNETHELWALMDPGGQYPACICDVNS